MDGGSVSSVSVVETEDVSNVCPRSVAETEREWRYSKGWEGVARVVVVAD